MTKVLLIMYRQLMSDAMMSALSGNPNFKFFLDKSYKNAEAAARTYMPDIALMEIPESKAYHPEDYLIICDGVKSVRPDCKLMLMCPENSSESRQAAVEAMRSGRIDDFIYYNVSMDYLESKLEVLSKSQLNEKQKVKEKIS